jgi:hypothetical protein
MNLVAYEYVACQQAAKGVLVLSEFAGAAQALEGPAHRLSDSGTDTACGFQPPSEIARCPSCVCVCVCVRPADRGHRHRRWSAAKTASEIATDRHDATG